MYAVNFNVMNLFIYFSSVFLLTRTNPCEKPTADLERNYKLVASIDDIKAILNDNCTRKNLTISMETKHPRFCKLWTDTFIESNKFHPETGLAPRCSKLGMVTGAVLHCLLALEHSVVMRNSMSERSLKIIRVETSNDGQRFVGVKYPVDDAALVSLKAAMKTLEAARNGASIGLLDEEPGPVQLKSVIWLSSAPKTMKSFFKATSSKRKESSAVRITFTPNKRGKAETTDKNKHSRKPKSITSFFMKPKQN